MNIHNKNLILSKDVIIDEVVTIPKRYSLQEDDEPEILIDPALFKQPSTLRSLQSDWP